MLKFKFTLSLILLVNLFFIGLTPLSGQEKFNSMFIYELMDNKTLSLDEIKAKADLYFLSEGNGKGSGYKQFMRWYYEQQFHIDANGFEIPIEVEMENYTTGLRSMKATSNRSAWVELGPINFNTTSSWNPGIGRIRHLCIDPTNNQIYYASSDGGGVWKSQDAGQNWSPTMDGKTSDYFSTNMVAVDPSNNNIVYAVLRNYKVAKSTDGGNSWNFASASGPTTAKRILINPSNTNELLVTSSSGIHRSTNGGVNWTLVLSASGLEDILYQPGSTTTLFAAGSGTQCFWKSTDGGVNWTNITSGVTNTGRTLIGVSPSNPSTLYLVQANGNLFGRLYKSTDAGQSFVTTVIGNPANGTNYFGYEPDGTGTSGQATHDMAIAVNPTNSEIVHIAGIICFKSTNGGISFSATTDWVYPNAIGYNHADVHYLGFQGSTLYSTSDGGVCKSINDGDDWTYLWNTLATRQVYRIACAKTEANTIGCGAQDNGQAYRVAGVNWNQWLGADGMDVVISPTNHLVAIGTIQNGGIYRTTNGGSSYSGLSQPSAGAWVTPLVWHPTSGNTVYGGFTGIYRSDNQGTSWTKISGTTIGSTLSCLAVANSDPNYIYGSVGTTLYVTTNGGTSWSTYGIGATISSIAVNPLTPTKVYITTTASSNNVLVSVNAGASFTSISSGLPAIAARSITVDDNTEESLYVGMNAGVYYKDNINTSWSVFGTGLPNVAIQEVEIQKSSSKLRLATYGRGVWETDLFYAGNTCNSPTALSTSGITQTSANLSWGAVNNALDYTVEYKESTSGTWNLAGTTTSTILNLTGLTLGTNYDWRVRTNCLSGNSAYANATFTTSSPCGSPSNTTTTSITGSSATLSWSAVVGAVTYTPEYKLASSSNWTVMANTSSTSISLSALFSSTAYEWRVKTNCASETSNYSTINAFTTAGCTNTSTSFASNTLTHSGTGSTSTTKVLTNASNVSFTITNINRKLTGNSNSRFIDIVTVEYVDGNGSTILYGTYSGSNVTSASISITGSVQSVKVSLSDGYDGNGPNMSVTLSSINYCQSNLPPQTPSDMDIRVSEMICYPNPGSGLVNVKLDLVEQQQSGFLYIESLDGRILYSKPIEIFNASNNYTIDLTSFLSGNYLVHIRSKDVNMYSKIVKL